MKSVKILLLLISVIFSSYSYSCSCVEMTIEEKYEESDFIAIAKIKKVKYSKYGAAYRTIEIEIVELFKGREIKSLTVMTNAGTCSLYILKNSEWLIYAKKDDKGNLSFGYCSGSFQLDKAKQDKEKSEIIKSVEEFNQVEIKHLRRLKYK